MGKFMHIILFTFTLFLQSEGAHKNNCGYYNFHAVSGQRNVFFTNETIEDECIAWVEFEPKNEFGSLKEYHQKMNDLCSSLLPDGKAYGIRLGEQKKVILNINETTEMDESTNIKANFISTYEFLLNMWVYREFSSLHKVFIHTYGTISSDVNVTIPVVNHVRSACPLYFTKAMNFKCDDIHKLIKDFKIPTLYCFVVAADTKKFAFVKCLNLTINATKKRLLIPCKHESLSMRCKKWDFNAKRCKKCSLGFTGDLCEQDIDECINLKIRRESGRCINHKGGYTSICNPGYIGEYCELIDYCASNPCPTNSTCKNSLNSYSCVCSEKYVGNQCLLDTESKAATIFHLFIVIGKTYIADFFQIILYF
ncbi:Neurogenic locus notch -like protein 3 [Trichinella spiralis]|uniref:Neurogenic locus notch-like protein 3 n=1 Tax=Trichinella spiralis TaxID=6334 RepID=A0A0V1C0P3_TRISP|nr:Neurogenic locus notch -like protein 3 [Trichinella spiralis]